MGSLVLAAQTVMGHTAEMKERISQVSKAIIRIEQVTQSAAAHAEESAATSHELMTHAQSIGVVVEQLHALVTGEPVRPSGQDSGPPR